MPDETMIARLSIRLKGYLEPDTSAQLEGFLEPGDWLVEEVRKNHPDAGSDYARIVAPSLGAGDTWICTRWRDHQYAELIGRGDKADYERRDFSGDPLAVQSSKLLDGLTEFTEFTYDLDDARYPYELPGVQLPLAPPKYNNCCTFVEALLAKAWADVHPGSFVWGAERHRQMMILSSDDYFSPVTAAVESGMAVACAAGDERPQPWTIIQGWRAQWRDGHTFLVLDYHPGSDKVLTLESNSAYKLDGVGYRGIGNLRDHEKPPADWWTYSSVWTWKRICSTYRYRQQAVLKVF